MVETLTTVPLEYILWRGWGYKGTLRIPGYKVVGNRVWEGTAEGGLCGGVGVFWSSKMGYQKGDMGLFAWMFC